MLPGWKHFDVAQRNENIVISIADQTLIKPFLATCINMKDMADMPGGSKEHDKYLKGLRSNLEMVHIREFKVNLTLDQILEPAGALKLAHESRQQKPMISMYPLHIMETAADANDGNQKDEGMIPVGNIFPKKKITM